MSVDRVQHSTMADHAVAAIRRAILDGTLDAGSALRETKLAEQLGISRAPTREALHRLEEEGLVVRVPFRGSYVAEGTPEQYREINELRQVLEPYAIKTGQERLSSPEGLAQLREALEAMEHNIDHHDKATAVDAHLAFHRTLYWASGNGALLDVWGSWESKVKLYLAIQNRSEDVVLRLGAKHRRLFELIESQDFEGAAAEFHNHFRVYPEPEGAAVLPLQG